MTDRTPLPSKGLCFIPNTSFGPFRFGDNISHYVHLYSCSYEANPNKNEGFGFDSYDFHTLGLSVWTNADGTIASVRSDTYCYWNDINIIGMSIREFRRLFQLEPDGEDIFYLLHGEMKSQHVYDFDSVGLQLWTWYGKIKTVIATRLPDE